MTQSFRVKKVISRMRVEVNLKMEIPLYLTAVNVSIEFAALFGKVEHVSRMLRPVAIENSRLGIRSTDVRQRRDTSTFCRQSRKLRSARPSNRCPTCTATYYLSSSPRLTRYESCLLSSTLPFRFALGKLQSA